MLTLNLSGLSTSADFALKVIITFANLLVIEREHFGSIKPT